MTAARGRPQSEEAEHRVAVTRTPGPAFLKCVDLRVARRIRERRLRLGMTQQRLAQLIGVAFQQAHKYERGISRISAGRLYYIANALGAPIAYFFEEDGPAQPACSETGANGKGEKELELSGDETHF